MTSFYGVQLASVVGMTEKVERFHAADSLRVLAALRNRYIINLYQRQEMAKVLSSERSVVCREVRHFPSSF